MNLDGGKSMYVDLKMREDGVPDWDRHNQKPSPEGRKVIYLDENGWDYDREKARKYFTKGQVLTVQEIYVGRSSSEVFFKEVPDVGFNTVMFEDVENMFEDINMVTTTYSKRKIKNLYTIEFQHYSQKDSQAGVIAHVIAENDEQIYEWLKSEPKLDSKKTPFYGLYSSYSYKEEDDSDFKNRIIASQGDMYDDKSEVYDLYYGATQYGWSLIKENITEENIKVLKNTIYIIDLTEEEKYEFH